jgi:hypothetical protein
MSIRNHILLEHESSQTVNFNYSEKNKGAGYHSISSGLHTVQYIVDNFNGTIILQGTLSSDPGDIDWVDIPESFYDSLDSTTIPMAVNFNGNFVWIRAKYRLNDGTIVKIQYNY